MEMKNGQSHQSYADKELSTLSFNFVIVTLLFIYVLSYPPFVFSVYLPTYVRLSIEGLILLTLTLVNLQYHYIRNILWFVSLVLVYALVLLIGNDSLLTQAGSINKFIFLFLVMALLSNNLRMLKISIALWLKFSYLLAWIAIISFVGNITNLIPFNPYDLGASINGVEGSYFYLHNPILGNLHPRSLLGIQTGRVAGYMFEANLLGAFYSLNIVAAKNWIVSEEKRKKFMILNFLAGLTTLSTSFLIFFSIYLFVKAGLREKILSVNLRSIFAVIFGGAFVFFIVFSNFFDQTSGANRLSRFLIYLDVFSNNTWMSFTFGNGINYMVNNYSIGIDAGWISLLIERGLLILGFWFILAVMITKHNRWLMFYVLYCHLAINLFWQPLFLLCISISYAHAKFSKNMLFKEDISRSGKFPAYQSNLNPI